MAKTPRDRLASLIREVEKAATRIRGNISKRARAETKNLQKAAAQLLKAAADVAGQVERYVQQLRKDLEASLAKPARPAKRARSRSGARRKTARRTRRAAWRGRAREHPAAAAARRSAGRVERRSGV
jgi:hypothetical protein